MRERAPVPVVKPVQVGAGLEQDLDHGVVSEFSRDHEQGLALRVFADLRDGACGSVFGQQCGDFRGVARPHGCHERLAHFNRHLGLRKERG